MLRLTFRLDFISVLSSVSEFPLESALILATVYAASRRARRALNVAGACRSAGAVPQASGWEKPSMDRSRMAGSDGRAGEVRLRLGFSARPSGSPGGRRDPAVAGHPSRMAWRGAAGRVGPALVRQLPGL